MWLVQSVFERVDVIGRLTVRHRGNPILNFHMWTGVKNFRPESGVKFFIHEIGVNFLSGMFNLVPHVKFLICIHFKHVSGVKQVWNRHLIGHPGLWWSKLFSTLKPLNGIQRNLTGSKISMSSTMLVFFFWADRKNKMASLFSVWLRHFRLLLWDRWQKFNESWQEARSQCPLPSLCFSGWSEWQS